MVMVILNHIRLGYSNSLSKISGFEMKYKASCSLGLSMLLLSSVVTAKGLQGIEFHHHDWEMVCSNTGTCQAAGYQEDNGEQPVSILLTRKAGANQAVRGEVAIGDYEGELKANQLKNIELYVNDRSYGLIQGDFNQSATLALSKTQVNAILQQSKKDAQIVFKNQYLNAQVSSKGMTAVLLKMDEFQHRVGTIGALIKKGPENESKVLAAQPMLVVKQVHTAKQATRVLKADHPDFAKLKQRLLAVMPAQEREYCDGAYLEDNERDIELYSLGNKRQLALMLCWRGAYNEGLGAWLLDDRQGQKTQFITNQASEFDQGELYGSQKGRGLGDCWVSYQWIWDGQSMVQTLDRWTGMCRMIAAGGAWELDKIETVVK